MKIGKKLVIICLGILCALIIFKAFLFLLGFIALGVVSSFKLGIILIKFALTAFTAYIIYKIITKCMHK